MSSPENHPAGNPQDSTRPASGTTPGGPVAGQSRGSNQQPKTDTRGASPTSRGGKTSGKATTKTRTGKSEWGVFRTVVVLVGLVIAGFGAYYLITGTGGLPEADQASSNPTLENQFRFFAAMMVGVGAAFITIAVKFEWANMLWLVCLMVFIGGIGRVLSWAFSGTPHFMMIILMVIELAFPAALLVWHRYIAKTTEIRNEYAARG
ncbi:DUF4345 domain-containing protein [Arthrobacter sp. Hz1]